MNIHPDKSRVTVIQSRAEMNLDLINEYAQEMKDGTIFDAIDAIKEDEHFYIYNGAHRVEAARQINFTLDISWIPGTRADAEWAALAANTKHGLRRSRATKQRVTKNALLHEKGAGLSDREIARWCQVDHKTVGKIRADLVASGEIPQIDERTVTRNGTEYTQAAKAEPTYISVWNLELGIQAWLNSKWYRAPKVHMEVLTDIKNKKVKGPERLQELVNGDILAGPRRKRDVVQAVNNVLDQMEQAATAKPDTRCTQCGSKGAIFFEELWKCKDCYAGILAGILEARVQEAKERELNEGIATEIQEAKAQPTATKTPDTPTAQLRRELIDRLDALVESIKADKDPDVGGIVQAIADKDLDILKVWLDNGERMFPEPKFQN